MCQQSRDHSRPIGKIHIQRAILRSTTEQNNRPARSYQVRSRPHNNHRLRSNYILQEQATRERTYSQAVQQNFKLVTHLVRTVRAAVVHG